MAQHALVQGRMNDKKADEDVNLEQQSKRLVYSKNDSRFVLLARQQDNGQSNSNESRFLHESQSALPFPGGPCSGGPEVRRNII